MAVANPQAVSTQEVPEISWLHGSPWQPTAMWGLTWVALVFLLSLGLWRKRKSPGLWQNACEFLYEWLDTNIRDMVGEDGMAYFPFYACIFIYVFFNNLLGLIPGLASATASPNTTIALAAITILATHILGLRKRGSEYVTHFFHLVDFHAGGNLFEKGLLFVLQFALLPVIEFVGLLAQPVSLSARLFGNIFGKETILAVLAALMVTLWAQHGLGSTLLAVLPLVLRPGIIVLGVLVSLIQAVVFTALAMVYMTAALGSHHVEGSEAPGHGSAVAGRH